MCFTWGAAEREPTDSMSRATFCFWSGFRKSVCLISFGFHEICGKL